jgi:hypothetical protein
VLPGLFARFSKSRYVLAGARNRMPTQYHASDQNLRDYWQLFVNRRAYVIQSMQPHPESGRHFYFRPKAGREGDPLSLDETVIRHHLEGVITIGLYAMNPSSQRCKWIAVDGDYDGSLKHLCELQWELETQKIESALEMSRRGGHLWIFGEQPLIARDCRLLIAGVAQKLDIPVKSSGTAEGIEIFPKHDELKEGEFGNAVRGPLGIHRAIGVRYWFYGADYSFTNQLAYLNRVKRLSEQRLTTLIEKIGRPSERREKRCESGTERPRQTGQIRSSFRILEHVEVRRKVGRNWVTRCPSCAADGRDKGGDNLAISVSEPQKYICWAGCTKEMIRAALGHPILEKRVTSYA